MPRPAGKRESLHEADNCDKRAVELADQDDIDTISRTLICHPEAIRHIINKLRNMGYNVDEFRGKAGKEKTEKIKRERHESVGSATSKGVAKRIKTLQDEHDQSTDDVTDANGEKVKRTLQVPVKYWHCEEMTPTYLATNLLCKMEPISCSLPNLKSALMGRGMKTTAQLVMQEIFEMMTGFTRRHKLKGQSRILSSFIAECVIRNEKRGRRFRDLPMPPDWTRFGIYAISVTGKEVLVIHNYTKQSFEIQSEIGMPEWTKTESLYIADNYSEVFAAVRSREDAETAGVVLQRIFPKQYPDVIQSIKDLSASPSKEDLLGPEG